MPLAIALVRLRNSRVIRRRLGLGDPPIVPSLARPAALAILFVLLGLAAAQPFLHVERRRLSRTDVEVMVVLDSSRSMLASSGPHEPARWRRAASFAARLPAALPGVPIGLSSLTNRVLPYIFPTSDAGTYRLVLREAYGIERPPPALTIDKWVTVFDPLAEVTRRSFFSPGVRKRILVVLTDAEAHPFDARALLRQLERAHTTPVVVRFWAAGERIFQPGSESYRASQPGSLAQLRAAGWEAFPEQDQSGALRAIRAAVGSGPTSEIGYQQDRWELAPFLIGTAFVLLVLLVAAGGHLSAATSGLRGAR